jgi:hypothetical protein
MLTPRPDKRRSRIVLKLAVILIFSGEILGSFIIDRAPLDIRFPDAAKVVGRVTLHRKVKPILFFGTSRFQNDVSPDRVNQELKAENIEAVYYAFNAAVPAGDPIAVEYLNEKLTELGVVPAVALIEVLPETVSRRNSWLQFHLARQFRWPEVWLSIPDAFRAGRLHELLMSRLAPLSFFGTQFQEWAAKALDVRLTWSKPYQDARSEDSRELGFVALTPDLLKLRATTARRRLRQFKVGGRTAQALESVVRRLRAGGANVLLIAAPVPRDYRKEYHADIDTQFVVYMNQLSRTYGADFYDYRARIPDNFFQGRYYMTEEGSLYFSGLIAKEVLAPLLKHNKGNLT